MSEQYTVGYYDQAVQYMANRSAASHAAFLLSHLRPGFSVLDCGCGPGSITLGLATAVAPGRVTGIDFEASQIEKAQATAETENVQNVEFRQANVYALPFPEGAFDAVLAHAVLEHLKTPDLAIAEMRRVLKPGGLMGVSSPDWGGHLYAPWDERLEFALDLCQGVQRGSGGDTRIGRKLPFMLKAAGLVEVTASPWYEVQTDVPLNTMVLARTIESAIGRETELGLNHSADTVQTSATYLRDWGKREDAFVALTRVAVLGRRPLTNAGPG